MLSTILALSVLSPGWSQDLDPLATDPLSPAHRPLAQTHRLLLVGTTAPRPVDLPGISGGFGLAEYRIEAAGPEVSSRLQDLRHALRSAALPELHYQILSQDMLTRSFNLSDVMRLPGTVEEESSPVGGTMALSAPDTDISYPTIASITLTLDRAPARSIWTRHLTFTDHRGEELSVPIGFAPVSGLTWKGAVSAAGQEALRSLAVTGNRSHWDDMKLVNRGGSTALDIARFTVILHYDKNSYFERDIPLVDTTINRTLGRGTTSIDLDDFALATRKSFGRITPSMPLPVQLAAADLGKSGSDGSDAFGRNPKFNARDVNLCSEFVSWYYHEAGVRIGGDDFRDIVTTENMDQVFISAGRGYNYHNGVRAWIQTGSNARYLPQPGDMLARLRGGEYQHSMMVIGWNDATKVMTVINGPWPVTVRYVPVQELEESGYDFRVGRIR